MLKPPPNSDQNKSFSQSFFSMSDSNSKEEVKDLNEIIKEEVKLTEKELEEQYRLHKDQEDKRKGINYEENIKLNRRLNKLVNENQKKKSQLSALKKQVNDIKYEMKERMNWEDGNNKQKFTGRSSPVKISQKLLELTQLIKDYQLKADEEDFVSTTLQSKIERDKESISVYKQRVEEIHDAYIVLQRHEENVKRSNFLANSVAIQATNDVVHNKNETKGMKKSYKALYGAMYKKKQNIEEAMHEAIERIATAKVAKNARGEQNDHIFEDIEQDIDNISSIRRNSEWNIHNLKNYVENFKVIEKLMSKGERVYDFSKGISENDTNDIIQTINKCNSEQTSLGLFFANLSNDHVEKQIECDKIKEELNLCIKDMNGIKVIQSRPNTTYNLTRTLLDGKIETNLDEETVKYEMCSIKIHYFLLSVLFIACKTLHLAAQIGIKITPPLTDIYDKAIDIIESLKKARYKRANTPQQIGGTSFQRRKKREADIVRKSTINRITPTSSKIFNTEIDAEDPKKNLDQFVDEIMPTVPLSVFEITQIFLGVFPELYSEAKLFASSVKSNKMLIQILERDRLQTYLKSKIFQRDKYSGAERSLADLDELNEQVHQIFRTNFQRVNEALVDLYVNIRDTTSELIQDENLNKLDDKQIQDIFGNSAKEVRISKKVHKSMKKKLKIDSESETPQSRFKLVEKVPTVNEFFDEEIKSVYRTIKENPDSIDQKTEKMQLNMGRMRRSESQPESLSQAAIIHSEVKGITCKLKGLKKSEMRALSTRTPTQSNNASPITRMKFLISPMSVKEIIYLANLERKSRVKRLSHQFPKRSLSRGSTAYTVLPSEVAK
ncbi:unnamed protein product [Blepharisma stoltei]|uniref:Uncharacterized protein n=1 Tax=Blepharisma stoltei TaxID=1481888 RepID=A0AAU9IJT2_9CILI|nr:unnamed protein product [Blepharisma stoltei]